jgi:hypothetical protein
LLTALLPCIGALACSQSGTQGSVDARASAAADAGSGDVSATDAPSADTPAADVASMPDGAPDAMPDAEAADATTSEDAATPGGPATSTGSIMGQAPQLDESVSNETLGGNLLQLTITLDSQSRVCGDLISNVVHSANWVLTIHVATGSQTGTPAPITPGTYAIGLAGNPPATVIIGDAYVAHYDSACTNTVGFAAGHAASGSIVLNSVPPDPVAGTYTLGFGNDQLTGTFQAPICNYQSPTTRPACGP